MAAKNQADLWGDLPAGKASRTPVTILKEQADLLGKKTGNVLRGRLRAPIPTSNIAFGVGDATFDTMLTLEIVAPALNSYSIAIMEMLYSLGVGNYPLVLIDKLASASQQHKCETPEEFEHALKTILSSEKVRSVIQALLSQAQVVS